MLRRMDRAAARVARRQARQARRGHRVTAGAAWFVVAAGAAVAAGVLSVGTVWDLPAMFEPRQYIDVDGEAFEIPRPAASAGRLAPEVPVTTRGSHGFLHVDEVGNPVGYDPCRPVRYVVRPDGAPASGQVLVEEAIAIVAAATGLVFEDAGTTDEPPALDRALIQPDRYGEGWAPVLLAWSDESSFPELAGQVAGMGGSAAVPGSDGQGQWLAAGRVVLDTADITAMLARPDGHAQARAIVVHELAHVLGLDHVDDPTELMHPVSAARTDLGPGDREGLALLGQAACE